MKKNEKIIASPYLLVLTLSCYSHFFFAQSVTYVPDEYENIADFDFRLFLKMDSVQKAGAIHFSIELEIDKDIDSIYNPFSLLTISLWQDDERGRPQKITLNPQPFHLHHHSVSGVPKHYHHEHHLPLPNRLRKTFELLSATENGEPSEYDFIDHNNGVISLKKGVLSCHFVAKEMLKDGEVLPIPAGQYSLDSGMSVEYEEREETIHFDEIPVRLE